MQIDIQWKEHNLNVHSEFWKMHASMLQRYQTWSSLQKVPRKGKSNLAPERASQTLPSALQKQPLLFFLFPS